MKISVIIKGISPLLMHAFPMQPIEAFEKLSPEAQAEYAAYRHPDTKQLVIPSICLQRAFISAASYSKGKGRGSLQKNAAACFQLEPEYLLLGTKKYHIDTRAVVVPATKGRVIRYRPRLDDWSVTFTCHFDERLLTEPQVRRIIDDCGNRVGILDFRPEKRGAFGRFIVTEWKTKTE